MNEELIKSYMSSLDLTREEAIDLIKSDEEVDKLNTIKELQSDLTQEQKKVIKAMKNTKRGVDAFGKKRVREIKSNPTKARVIEMLRDCLARDSDISDVEIDSKTREGKVHFKLDGKHYTVMLTEHRDKTAK